MKYLVVTFSDEECARELYWASTDEIMEFDSERECIECLEKCSEDDQKCSRVIVVSKILEFTHPKEVKKVLVKVEGVV